jgi:bifunctional non-homologous end joining protein LigD
VAIFVVQKHAATALHYDFRLELDGVLLSWAVPKGPSLDPKDKRLAMQVEDHALGYASFEGTIPKGEYGGGAVIVWDHGTWEAEKPRANYDRGRLSFTLHGEKLKGKWHLIRTSRTRGERSAWVLFKGADDEARRGEKPIVEAMPKSVISGKTLEQMGGERVRRRPRARSPAKGARR